ncbi:MAG: type I polyketide synthase [Anaerolineales bacterium]|nr:type I polyketide synthase [Anaerolineales bacterium]
MSSILSHTPELSPTKRALIAVRDMRLRLAAAERAQREPVAIIGMAHRFPGGANDPASFWQLLRDGVDAITRIPSERWDADLYYDPDPNAAGRAYTRDGGFLDAVDQFDAAFFGISPREALEMDPQQRLLLELAWEALERAGLPPDSLHGTATGVFVGISSVDFGRLRALQSSVLEVNAYMGTGNANSVAAGRLAYVLGLQGPNMAVDTACSSSLLAVHLACRSLRAGECRQALAGGVNLILTPESHIILSQARMLSPDGRCKTFDATADGYVRGEGAGLVVLKRLSDALADGDPVLAVIRGTATNQDGRSNGLTAPSGQAQEAVIRAALADAGVAPRQVSYVEAHGTGTTLGDPIEMRALGAVFGVDRPPETPLVVASVKTNIGHLEAAAGIAGLIKVVLMLQQSEVPPHLHLQEPNPYIPWETLPVEVPQRPRPWPAAQSPRLAGVNSFGFSGSNVHLIVEEAPPAPVAAPTAPAPRPLHLLTLAAANETALTDMAGRLRTWLAEAAPPLPDVAYTANAGRARLPQRLALVAADTADLDAKLAAFLAGDLPTGGTAGRAPAEPPRIAFLFTGQGAQYPNMARQLYDTEPTFRATLDECDALLRPHLEHGLLDVLFAAAAGGAADPDLIHQTAYTQPALFAVEVALARLWQAWGITPDFVTGHSIGEFAAAVIAGVFSLADGCKLVAARGRLMQALPRDGAMAAVFADEARVADAVAPFAAQVSIAGINGPQQVVISGAKTAVDAILAQLDADGIQSRSLSVSHAFHSPLMDPMLDAFAEVAATVTYAEPRIPLVSDVTGRVAAPGALTQPAYWRQHVRAAVRFADAVQTLHAEGCTHFLEIGPSPTLIGMGRRCLPDDAAVWLASLRHDRENWAQLLDSLAALYVSGAAVDWRAYDRPYGRQWVDLPTYPFQRRRFWPDTTAGTVTQLVFSGDPPPLGIRLPSVLRQVSFAG